MQTIVSLLERAGPTRVFTIWNVDDATSRNGCGELP
jgi:hypothetical protein